MRTKLTVQQLISEFATIFGRTPDLDSKYREEVEMFIAFAEGRQVRDYAKRRALIIAHANWKFRVNSSVISELYACAAHHQVTFNYLEKQLIQRSFDESTDRYLLDVLERRNVNRITRNEIVRYFDPATERQTIQVVCEECDAPSKLRKSADGRRIDNEILKALFSAFVFVTLDAREMHEYFDKDYDDETYHTSYWKQLQARRADLFVRNRSLEIVHVSSREIRKDGTLNPIRDRLCRYTRDAYESLNNYGYLVFVVDHLNQDGRAVEWDLVSSLILFCEKHREEPLKHSFFRWREIANETVESIPGLNLESARFDLASEGLTYRDSIVTSCAQTKEVKKIVVVFQKNRRDETKIACPSCRSLNVRGNSYPSLGVRSWECQNLLCPDRSKYNRGKRYSFKGLLMQQALEDSENRIPKASVSRWLRDVVSDVQESDIIDMLVRHYSMAGDTILVSKSLFSGDEFIGRKVLPVNLGAKRDKVAAFWDGPFFQRYIVESPVPCNVSTKRKIKDIGSGLMHVFNGDSKDVLLSIESDYFDGAVTSPPYYNAREYSEWKNLYTYLHDMFVVNKEVYRTLRPGALYFYNIFDYFDNERTVALSAMGNKRIPLSAYTVDSFKRIGFEVVGNIVWDKGDIEGKRGFNSGNYSPYYQSPFNCWEHILVFRKPAVCGLERNNHKQSRRPSFVWAQRPVLKWVGGQNRHGHSAPFPDELPMLLIGTLSTNSVILDPFAGSLTTGRVAEARGVESVCVEMKREYCDLGMHLRRCRMADDQHNERQKSLI